MAMAQSPLLGAVDGMLVTQGLLLQLSRLQHSPSAPLRASACLALQALLPKAAVPQPFVVSASSPTLGARHSDGYEIVGLRLGVGLGLAWLRASAWVRVMVLVRAKAWVRAKAGGKS